MIQIARTDRSLVGTWWWTVDRVFLAGIALLLLTGTIVVFAASPPVARVLGYDEMFFILKHAIFVLPAIILLLGVSLLAPLGVLRLAIAMFVFFGVLLFATLFVGIEIKGAHRWVTVAGVVLQPSEFMKPALVVVVAYILAARDGFRGFAPATVAGGVVLALLVTQPDLGMTAVVASVLGIQLFVAGLPWILVVMLACIGAGGVWIAYLAFPHVTERIDSFLDAGSVGYQVEKALRAVASGGLFGRGPGEGIEKYYLPDAHTDFVFAATAEEFGIAACLLLVLLFAFLFLRGLWKAHEAGDRFCQFVACGLISQFGLQALINMAVNLNLMPTKGMTLPFISYGGSSMLAVSIGMGMLLAVTRRGARLELPD